MEENNSSPRALPVWAGLTLAVCSGALMACSFAPLDWGGCVWVALLPLLTALWKGPKREGKKGVWTYALYGWAYGVVFMGISLWWLNEVSTLGYLAILAFYAGVFPAVWAAVTATAFSPALKPVPAVSLEPEERRRAWKAWAWRDIPATVSCSLGAAALWVCLEWVRGWLIPGFGWNNTGVALYGNPIAQWAEFIGVTGLAFIPTVFACWLWCAARRAGIMVTSEGRRSVPWDFFGLVSVLLLMFVTGVMFAAQYAPGGAAATADGKALLPVMVVQPNLSQHEKWDAGNRLNVYRTMLDTTADGFGAAQTEALQEAIKSGRETAYEPPCWVIWPESAFPSATFYRESTGKIIPMQDNLIMMMADTSQFGDIYTLNKVKRLVGRDFVLLAGTDEKYVDDAGWTKRAYNCLSVFEGDYSTVKSHAKAQLVPFGEYIPLRDTFPILEKAFEFSAGAAMGANYEKGDSTEPLMTPLTPGGKTAVGVIPLICFEDVVGDWARRFIRAQRQVLVNVTNDGWFNRSWANEQHWRNAAFRCIELRRAMVRSANTGVSVALAPNGAVIKDLRDADGSPFVRGTMYVVLPVGCTVVTLYAMLGDWFVLVCLLVFAGLLLRRALTRKKKAMSGTVVDGVYKRKSGERA